MLAYAVLSLAYRMARSSLANWRLGLGGMALRA